MPHGIKTSKETVQEIAKLSAEGWGANQIATRLGVSDVTVYRYLPAEAPRQVKSTPEDIQKWAEHYAQGWSISETAKWFGISGEAVRKAFRRAGFPIRQSVTVKSR
jgi:transposase